MSDEPKEILGSDGWWAKLDREITRVRGDVTIEAGKSMQVNAACDFFGLDPSKLTVRQAGSMRRALDSTQDKERFVVQLTREYLQAGKSADLKVDASGPVEWETLPEMKRLCLANYRQFLEDDYNADGTLRGRANQG